MDVLFLCGGLALLVVGGDLLVRGAASLAIRLRVAPVVIGLVIVGFGTSTPELMASVKAALAGADGVAIGNVIGSNIANILLILGLGAAMAPIRVPAAGRMRDLLALAGATALIAAIGANGEIGRVAGAAMVGLLVLYIAVLWRSCEGAVEEAPAAWGAGKAVAAIVAGLVLLLFGADRLVVGAVNLARDLGVDETIIGLTVVAVGTSLPELAATIAAARRGATDIAYGNVVGSNIFNALGVLGAAALASPLRVPESVIQIDLWVMAAATAALIALAWAGGVSRLFGAALLAGYGLFVVRSVALA